MVDKIEGGDVVLVINTPTGTAARTDGYEIRRAAIARGIPCITTMAGGMAAARAIAAARHGEPGGACRCRRSTARAAPAPRRCARERRRLAPLERPARAGRRARAGHCAAGASTAPTSCSRSPTRDGPAPRPGQFAMLAAPSAGAAAPTSGRSCRARSRSRGATPTARSTSCSRTSAPARSGSPSCDAGDERLAARPARPRLRAAARGAPAVLVGGGVGIAPLAIWQDALGAGDALVLLGLPRRRPRRGRRAAERRRGSRPTTARSATTGS